MPSRIDPWFELHVQVDLTREEVAGALVGDTCTNYHRREEESRGRAREDRNSALSLFILGVFCRGVEDHVAKYSYRYNTKGGGEVPQLAQTNNRECLPDAHNELF
jgi:hypothetical protein